MGGIVVAAELQVQLGKTAGGGVGGGVLGLGLGSGILGGAHQSFQTLRDLGGHIVSGSLVLCLDGFGGGSSGSVGTLDPLQSLEALVGSTVDAAPKAAPKHPVNDTTTSKFASLNLQFGRNYEPGRK